MPSSSSMNMISLFFFFIFMITLFQANHASADSKQFIQQVLDGHNSVRRTVGAPALEYDHQLARVARDYAEERRHDCKLDHSPGHKYGENLFWGQRDSWTVKDAMTNWAAEKKYYSYKQNTCTDKQMCGHYTQMIWKTTTRVGCAHIKCDSGDTYIVCNYSPPGNYRGVKPY